MSMNDRRRQVSQSYWIRMNTIQLLKWLRTYKRRQIDKKAFTISKDWDIEKHWGWCKDGCTSICPLRCCLFKIENRSVVYYYCLEVWKSEDKTTTKEQEDLLGELLLLLYMGRSDFPVNNLTLRIEDGNRVDFHAQVDLSVNHPWNTNIRSAMHKLYNATMIVYKM